MLGLHDVAPLCGSGLISSHSSPCVLPHHAARRSPGAPGALSLPFLLTLTQIYPPGTPTQLWGLTRASPPPGSLPSSLNAGSDPSSVTPWAPHGHTGARRLSPWEPLSQTWPSEAPSHHFISVASWGLINGFKWVNEWNIIISYSPTENLCRYVHIYNSLCINSGAGDGGDTVFIPVKGLRTLRKYLVGLFSLIHLPCIRSLLIFLSLLHNGKSILWLQFFRMSTKVYLPSFCTGAWTKSSTRNLL